MSKYKFTRINDMGITVIDKLDFHHINDALNHARKWLKFDNSLNSVEINCTDWNVKIERT